MPVASEREIQTYYAGKAAATNYVDRRFVSELHRLLHDRQVAAVQRVFDRHQPRWSLEIAPGPGRLTRELRPSGRLSCLEFNEGMIEQGMLSTGNERCWWIRGNGFQLPFGPVFDFVYSFRFIRHFHGADRRRLYWEIHRVLRPGGLFIMDAVNERISRPLRAAHPEEYPVYDKLYRPEELRAELSAVGLEVLTLEPVQRASGLQSRSQILLGPRSNLLNRLFIRSLERLPYREGLEWIVTCRRA